MQPGVAEIDQGVDVAVRDGQDGATPAAVAAIGAAHGNEFFPAETGDAVAALAGNDFDGGFVYEFHGEYILMKKKALLKSRAFLPPDCSRVEGAAWGPFVGLQSDQFAVFTETVRLFCAPLTANCTTPSTREYSVWSLPMPTFTPG